MARHRMLALLTVLAAVTLPACGGVEPPPTDITIAVVPKATGQLFWKSVHAGALKAGREFGVKILWQGPLTEDDRDAQIRAVDTVASQGVQGLLLAPVDEQALRAPVATATRAGIPVVIIDSNLDSQDHLSLVATANLVAGRLAGAHMAKILGGSGHVILMRLQKGAASTTAREEGFLEALADFPGITVISADRYAGALAEDAFRTGESLLAATRAADGQVQGIFCPNESTSSGMLRALQKAGLAGKIRYIGFDSSDTLVQGLRDGHLDALVLQNPFGMGYIGVKVLAQHIRGGRIDRFIDTGVAVVTRENMNQPEIRERLQPNFDESLK